MENPKPNPTLSPTSELHQYGHKKLSEGQHKSSQKGEEN
jgi:hypothetical protein